MQLRQCLNIKLMGAILVKHRVNTIKDLVNTPPKYGIEVDIREKNGSLICCHDPFQNGELFKDFITHFEHKFLIANIKEEGIEKKVINLLHDCKISNYFLLDVSFPFLYKLSNERTSKIALRVSDLETLNLRTLKILGIEWIWLDAFKKFPSGELEKIKSLSDAEQIKVCLVSPELHMNRSNLKSDKIRDQIIAADYIYDAICTKETDYWEK